MVYDLIIIGGGPAGITAGIYAARARLYTLLITKGFGGQVARKAVAIENYPGFEEISGQELIQRFEKHLRRFEIEIKEDSVIEIKRQNENFLVFTETKEQFETRSLIVASGADPRPLEVPGEKEFIGKGVSYCTACDAPLFSDKTVAVVGGGDAGFEAAIALSNWAKKIYILEYGSRIKADEVNQERVKKTGKVEIITNAALKEIRGKDFVESIVYQERDSQNLKTLELQGVFVEIGSQPATSFLKGLVEFNERDEVVVNPNTGETNTPGLFAAGDIDQVPYKQIVVACGEGAKAALSVYKYLQKINPAKSAK